MTSQSAELAPTDNIVRRIVNAWDCCGTCAGGVLARYVAERERSAGALALHPLTDTERASLRGLGQGQHVAAVERILRERADKRIPPASTEEADRA